MFIISNCGNTNNGDYMLFKSRDNNIKENNRVLLNEKPDYIDLELKIENIKHILEKSKDVQFRNVFINDKDNLPVTVVFIDGLINQQLISDYILKPLVQEPKFNNITKEKDAIELIERGSVYFSSQKKRQDINDVISDVLSGSTALIFDKESTAFTFDTKGFEKRSITEPTGENVIKGAKDSFIENLRTNTATVRRKIKSHNLVIEETKVGKQSVTNVAIVYIKGITNRHIVEELNKRLDQIDTDSVITSGVIEENIIDNKYSPFPQVIYTERPDKFCANVVEGRVGIIIDGLPATYVVPATFGAFLQAPEDYSQSFIVSSVIRSLRFILTFITLFLPGFYVSLTTFHQEMIPTELALAITASKEGVPFPSFIEVIFMLVAFEVLIEAGLRLPKTIGQAVSIVGAVVVGQAAVEARLVSPTVVVIIAITAISSFTMPNQDFSNALRLWRFVFVLMSSAIGLFGLSLGGILLLHHLSSMEIYGIPYMSPFVGGENKVMQDSIFRLPFSAQYKRPVSLKTRNKKRQGQDGG